jgi:hypothetical protein
MNCLLLPMVADQIRNERAKSSSNMQPLGPLPVQNVQLWNRIQTANHM